MTAAKQAVIVCPPRRGTPLREVGGLTIVERLMRQLSDLGTIEEIFLVAAPGLYLPAASKRVSAGTRVLRSSHDEAWEMVADARELLGERFLLVAGDLIVDQRILDWLDGQQGNTLVKLTPQAPHELLGSINQDALQALAAGLPVQLCEAVVESFPTYSREQRGDVPVHLMRVTSERGAKEAWAVLLDHVEKRAKDLPATVFDPPVENFLVRLLAPTPITPNQVSFATTALGFFVAWLFWSGWLRLGIVLAIAVEVLDGVDGKLARIKRMTSRIGELEHVLDFFYEMSWYLGLGAYLAANGSAWAWKAALALCAFDLADNFAYLFFARLRSENLDEASTFSRRFRLIAGRRNIYTWLLLPAILGGAAPVSFAVVTVWAALTAVIHWCLAILESRAPARRRAETIPPETPAGATTAETRRH